MNHAHRLPHPAEELTSLLGDTPVLVVPGLNNSDPAHWQTLWQEAIPNSRRIQLPEWSVASLDKWRTGIERALAELDRPALLIAHSFGALAAASVTADFPRKIRGLFLVAPADPDKFGINRHLPHEPLPVPTQLIASSNDPWLSELKASRLALRWGTGYYRFKNVGHINSQSNLGYWPEGITQLRRLLKS